MLLRLVVGYHFYKEGTNKLKNGFTSKYFLAGAQGPFAPYFKQMLDDPEGREKLCVEENVVDGKKTYSVNTKLTFAIWDDFITESNRYYGFGSEELLKRLVEHRDEVAKTIRDANESGDEVVDILSLQKEVAADEEKIRQVQSQQVRMEEILIDHQEQLEDWLAVNKIELISHFGTAGRLNGFERDGKNREDVALYVDSLRGQVKTISDDRAKKLNGWTAEVTGIWDSLESQISSLAIEEQVVENPFSSSTAAITRPEFKLDRHFDQENSFVKWVDRIIPWFDTIVGVLLILGLFSRLASLAAAMFLVSVILTQPPWIPGTDPTYLYAIELMACLVIFSTGAGRFGGLDYFFSFPAKSSEAARRAAELENNGGNQARTASA
ncbi:MAG: DoxX family protein [Mariniblastus sp.]